MFKRAFAEIETKLAKLIFSEEANIPLCDIMEANGADASFYDALIFLRGMLDSDGMIYSHNIDRFEQDFKDMAMELQRVTGYPANLTIIGQDNLITLATLLL